MFPRCSVIVAARRLSNGKLLIGQSGTLPWGRNDKDMLFFSRMTTGNTIFGKSQNVVLMGRKTWTSLPKQPLPNRVNWILSKSLPNGMTWEQVRIESRKLMPPELWVIGGGEIYDQCFRELPIERIYLTLMERADVVEPASENLYVPDGTFLEANGDFVRNLERAKLVDESNYFEMADSFTKWRYKIQEYHLPIHPEYQYLNMIHQTLLTGEKKDDRTGTGTISSWGGLTRWNLQEGFPLLTTKKVFWKGVAEELLWFLRGDTDAKKLSVKGIRIWDANGTRDFLDNLGLTHRREGDLGPVYGFQWRNFGASYIDADTKVEGGIDQVRKVLDQLRKNPTDRRCLVMAWNPTALSEMALPPCHVLFQLQGVNGRLNTIFYQRSCDMGLGVPFNIASYALLTHIFAHILGWEVGELVHLMGDVHVYRNHEDALWEQLSRSPYNLPKLRIRCDPKSDPGDYTMEDFDLLDYQSHGVIKMKMAV